MRYPKIEQAVGLHTQLIIWYVVDGYQAHLDPEDAYPNLPKTEGDVAPTIEQALDSLESKL